MYALSMLPCEKNLATIARRHTDRPTDACRIKTRTIARFFSISEETGLGPLSRLVYRLLILKLSYTTPSYRLSSM